MDTTNEILGILDTGTGDTGFNFTILSLFKIPFVILLLGNILFVVLLFLRVRILTDTFSSPNNKLIKAILKVYITVVVISSLIALTFIIIA